LFILTSIAVSSQTKILSVSPSELQKGVKEVHGPDIAMYDTAVQSRGQLIFMIQGTGASAMDYRIPDKVFTKMGYHLVSVDYMNNVISTVCLHSKDSACADDFRREIITGDAVSNLVNVDSSNSILNRFKNFLQYLIKVDPEGKWGNFFVNGRPRWKDIIVAGHSQGAGHAAYLGKMFDVSRVLIFSGPQDYLEGLKIPAPWLSMKSATPADRYYAFLNLKDPFNVNYQILNCEKLMGLDYSDTMMVSPRVLIDGHSHILVNDILTIRPHISTMFPMFRNVWAYMLGIKYHPKTVGYLHAEGKKIVNGNGKEVLLKGIGLGGWMVQEPYMLKLSGVAVNQQDIRDKITALIGKEKTNEFYNAWLKDGMQKSDVDSLKAWGFNSIRLPMHYDLFTLPVDKEPVSGKNTWLKKGSELTDSLLKWCTEDHIYLILDLHAAPGGQGHDLPIADRDSTKPSLWQSKADRYKTIALWKKLAERYKDAEWIGGYDLLNEPNWSFEHPSDKNDHGTKDTGNAPLRKLLINITKAIRSVDKNHLIFIEGNGWANNYNGIMPPWDNNMCVSFHKYWNKNDVASIQKYLDIRNEYHVPLWLGESGENNNEWYRDAIQLVESHDIGWSWWPLKKIGTNNPFEVKMPVGFENIIQYWKGKAPKPSAQNAFKALMQLAENYKTKNLIVYDHVLDALFGGKR
ncbi:MAG: glycoside hydrolase family 5 protein, partial [Chitinophagaceae bacterium]